MSQTNNKNTQNVTVLNIHGVYVQLVFANEPNMSARSIVRDILKESYMHRFVL